MAYFADGTAYTYGDAGDARPLYNVGWLKRDQPFPTAKPASELVTALLRCALRPAALSRGYHTCDLCSESTEDFMAVEAFGRPIMLGNGEIHVFADDVGFAAPTLVAHYVAEHDYAPPEAFVTAVFARARTIPVADVDVIAEIRGLDPKGRRARAWSIAERLAHALGDDTGAQAITKLRGGARATIDRDSPFGAVFAQLEMLVVYDVRVAHPSDDARQRGRLLEMIEGAQGLGLREP